MSRAKYEEFFKEADTDNSKTLSYDEVVAVLKKKGYKKSESELKAMFHSVDISGDGLISMDEYLQAMGEQPPDVHEGAAMRRCFLEFDKNRDGKIDKAELTKVFQELKHCLPEDQIQGMIKLADADNSGTIEYEEFIKFAFGK